MIVTSYSVSAAYMLYESYLYAAVADPPWEHDAQAAYEHEQIYDRRCEEQFNSTDSCTQSTHPTPCTTKCMSAHTCEYWIPARDSSMFMFAEFRLSF